jgi:hemerythrin
MNDLRRSCAQINEMLEQLKQVCLTHFRYEEQILEELHYPPTAEQKQVHDTFLSSIDALKCSDSQCHSPASVTNFLQLRLAYIANTNNETIMLCNYITDRIPER